MLLHRHHHSLASRPLCLRFICRFCCCSALEVGDKWAATIQAAIQGCQVFVAVCSPEYGATEWTYRE